MDLFEKQDLFVERLKQDYKKSLLGNDVFAPYFKWKFGGGTLPSLIQARQIESAIIPMLSMYHILCPNAHTKNVNDSSDPWSAYQSYGKEKYFVSYLEYIDDEIKKWIEGGILQ